MAIVRHGAAARPVVLATVRSGVVSVAPLVRCSRAAAWLPAVVVVPVLMSHCSSSPLANDHASAPLLSPVSEATSWRTAALWMSGVTLGVVASADVPDFVAVRLIGASGSVPRSAITPPRTVPQGSQKVWLAGSDPLATWE